MERYKKYIEDILLSIEEGYAKGLTPETNLYQLSDKIEKLRYIDKYLISSGEPKIIGLTAKEAGLGEFVCKYIEGKNARVVGDLDSETEKEVQDNIEKEGLEVLENVQVDGVHIPTEEEVLEILMAMRKIQDGEKVDNYRPYWEGEPIEEEEGWGKEEEIDIEEDEFGIMGEEYGRSNEMGEADEQVQKNRKIDGVTETDIQLAKYICHIADKVENVPKQVVTKVKEHIELDVSADDTEQEEDGVEAK